jgi:Putative Actinobacterial Holin-X, holin superfamily III
MTVVDPRPADTVATSEESTLARIAGELSEEVRQLARLELELARTEVGEAVTNAKKAGAGFGSAGVLGVIAVLFVSFAAAYALAEVLPTWAGFLIVAVVWALGAAAFFRMGRRHLRAFDPVPHRTIDSLKEDATWLRHRNS